MIDRMCLTFRDFTHARAQNLRIFRACLCVKLWFTGNSDCAPNTRITPQEITFFNLVTLTFDNETWPRYCWGTSPNQKSCSYIERFSCESAERQTDTHTHTQTGPILLPRLLTREVIKWGSAIKVWWLTYFSCCSLIFFFSLFVSFFFFLDGSKSPFILNSAFSTCNVLPRSV